jgi:hypothetical protein
MNWRMMTVAAAAAAAADLHGTLDKFLLLLTFPWLLSLYCLIT